MMQLTMPKDIKSIVIASHNEGKVREIRSLLDPYGYKIISAKNIFELTQPAPLCPGNDFIRV